MTTTKRKGRPPKPDKSPTSVVLAMRVPPTLYEEIRAEAERNGRSISAQAERRLAHREPDENDVARLLGSVLDAVQRRSGKSYRDDPAVSLQCRAAAEFALNILLGSPLAVESLQDAIREEFQRLRAVVEGKGTPVLDVMFQREPPSLEKAQELLDQLTIWAEGQRMVDEVLSVASSGADK